MRRQRRRQDRVEPPLPDTRGLGPEFSQMEGTDGITMPPATSPAVHASRVTQLVVTPPITSSLENPTSPIATSVASGSISEPLQSELQPTEAVPILNHDYEDSSSANITTPRESTISSGSSSPSSSAPLVPRSTRHLTDDEVDFVATLYRQRLPPSDVARIIENMLDEGEIGNKEEGPSSGTAVTEPRSERPI